MFDAWKSFWRNKKMHMHILMDAAFSSIMFGIIFSIFIPFLSTSTWMTSVFFYSLLNNYHKRLYPEKSGKQKKGVINYGAMQEERMPVSHIKKEKIQILEERIAYLRKEYLYPVFREIEELIETIYYMEKSCSLNKTQLKHFKTNVPTHLLLELESFPHLPTSDKKEVVEIVEDIVKNVKNDIETNYIRPMQEEQKQKVDEQGETLQQKRYETLPLEE